MPDISMKLTVKPSPPCLYRALQRVNDPHSAAEGLGGGICTGRGGKRIEVGVRGGQCVERKVVVEVIVLLLLLFGLFVWMEGGKVRYVVGWYDGGIVGCGWREV